MSEELCKKHRPKSFKELIGQETVVETLVQMGKAKKFPHTILLTGPSGCGKTTIARILKRMLKCSDQDFIEMNAAKSRGIDDIRAIEKAMFLAPINGKSRIWLVDESHQLTTQAQESFLKMLEDTPSHVYFFLCTTDPQKLKKTIITRATHVKVQALSEVQIKQLIQNVCEKEELEIPESVISRIAKVCEGSARKALVLLHQIMDIDDEDKQLEVVDEGILAEKESIEICRALMGKGTNWTTMREILAEVKTDPEQIRWQVLGYMSSVALKGNAAKAVPIMEEFRDHFYDCKKAGLICACYNAIK